jgi:uncharacterized membrane protein
MENPERNDIIPASGPGDGIIAWTHLIYALHAFSVITGIVTSVTIIGAFVFGWPSIIAVILNYVKRDDARGSFVDSHFSWQIRTFWYALAWTALAWLLIITIIGIPFAWILIMGISVWIAYRVIRGWVALGARKPMPTPAP